MSKRMIKNISIFAIFVLYIILYKVVLFQNFMKCSEIINASFLLIMVSLAIWLLGIRKYKSTYMSKNIFRVTIFYIGLAFVVMYGLGFVVGFLKNAYSRSFLTLLDNIVAPIIVIILSEIFRYVVLWANRDKKYIAVLYTILLTVFEIAISIRTLQVQDISLLFGQFATVLLPITIKNAVLSYLCYNIGYRVPLFYRLIVDIYIFLVPIVPDIGDYLHSMVFIALPSLIYIAAFTIIDEHLEQPQYIFSKENFSIWDIPLAAIVIILAALISGFFPHYMIGVGSDSMRPKINKGDALILKKVHEEPLKKGDVVAYKKGKKVIVHRIVEVHDEKGTVYYVTKGDANNATDPAEVKQSQVQGIVKIRIPYIAYPTVWLSEYFNSRK